ncbi:Eukaryotic translation initiation factor 3 subunit H [Symbiodinium microadriaticum]|uniref:Eukaryotic translation initiation factor 3 subunit H n=1 Tax=Symbiodinium microadriaticum TaxID=2951 RepID=A0A1Q9DY95_SYMMI|nr:Eukaryotic translation initiation factor 3 subunit H [Symbiodinium microadriaticum]
MASHDIEDVDKTSDHAEEEPLRCVFFHCALDVSVFIFLTLPAIFICITGIFALALAPAEGWTVHDAFGFMCAGVTGGAIQIQGHALTPQSHINRTVAALLGCFGVVVFGLAIAVLSALVPDRLLAATGLLPKVVTRRSPLRLGALVVVVVLLQLCVSFVFGGVLALLEGWDFLPAWRAAISAQLGGGLPLSIPIPSQTLSELVLVVVSCWAVGFVTLIISAASSLCTMLFQKVCTLDLSADGRPIIALAVFACLDLLVVPLVLVLAMCLVSLALLITEGGGAAVVLPYRAESIVEHLIVICASTVGFLILCAGMNMLSEPLGPLMKYLGFGPHTGETGGTRRALLRLTVAVVFVTPAFVSLMALWVGAILAAVEGWSMAEGFWWSAAAQLGGGMSLSSASVQTRSGRRRLLVGVGSSPAVEPLIERLKALAGSWRQLLGMDVGNVLQLTHSFGYVQKGAETETQGQIDEGVQFQMDTLRKLREVNVDSNTVGWYQTTHLGQFINKDVIHSQHTFQSEIPRSVLVVYDSLQAAIGKPSFKALQLTKEFMEM